MTATHEELYTSHRYQGLILPAHRTSGTEDDGDDRDDEHADENEARMRAVDESTETPEEFEIDDKDNLSHPEDDDADDDEEEKRGRLRKRWRLLSVSAARPAPRIPVRGHDEFSLRE